MVPKWSVEALQEQIREREDKVGSTQAGQLFQHITIAGRVGAYEVEVDEDPKVRRVFRSYNDALFYAIRFLSSCALQHGGTVGEVVHVPDDPDGVILQ